MGTYIHTMVAAKYSNSINKPALTSYTNDFNIDAAAIAALVKPKGVDPARFGTFASRISFTISCVWPHRFLLCRQL